MSDFETMTKQQYRRALALTALKWLSAWEEAARTMTPVPVVMRQRFSKAIGVDRLLQKNIGAGGMYSNDPPPTTEAFFAEVEAFAILGRLRDAGAPVVPSLTPTNTTSGDAAFEWTGEGQPAPAVALTFAVEAALESLKVAGVVVVTQDLMRLATPAATERLFAVVRDKYAAALDRKLLDPTIAAVPHLNPASLTNGLTPVTSAGTSTADMVFDARALLARFVGNGGHLERAIAVLSSANAVALRLSGAEAFRGLTREGGDYSGIPAIASDSAGHVIAIVDVSRVVFIDDGQASLQLSTQSDMQMTATPTQDGTTGTGAALTSLWQNHLVGIRIERHINWRVGSGAVQYLVADYAPAGSPA